MLGANTKQKAVQRYEEFQASQHTSYQYKEHPISKRYYPKHRERNSGKRVHLYSLCGGSSQSCTRKFTCRRSWISAVVQTFHRLSHFRRCAHCAPARKDSYSFVGAAPCGRPPVRFSTRPVGPGDPYPLCPFGASPPDRGSRPHRAADYRPQCMLHHLGADYLVEAAVSITEQNGSDKV